MDEAALSPYPHHSWLGTWTTVEADDSLLSIHMRQVAHCLIYTSHERADVRWIHRGREQAFTVDAGTTRIAPADGEQHTLLGRCRLGHRFFTLLIPQRHISAVAGRDGVETDGALRYSLQPSDPVLRSCLSRLGGEQFIDDADLEGQYDSAARRLVLRLVELSGGGRPDWHDDASVFDRRSLTNLVECIDAHLKIAPSLSDMGRRVGLCPSHFAKKFRQSTGLSLHRFVNRRRVLASLEALKDQSRPLSHVALDLGFSSQSHFAHIFNGLTGMTPAKYRKRFTRTVG